MGRQVVKELIQGELTVENLKQELKSLLGDKGRIAAIKKDYAELRQTLCEGGPDSRKGASARAAQAIIDFLSK